MIGAQIMWQQVCLGGYIAENPACSTSLTDSSFMRKISYFKFENENFIIKMDSLLVVPMWLLLPFPKSSSWKLILLHPRVTGDGFLVGWESCWRLPSALREAVCRWATLGDTLPQPSSPNHHVIVYCTGVGTLTCQLGRHPPTLVTIMIQVRSGSVKSWKYERIVDTHCCL